MFSTLTDLLNRRFTKPTLVALLLILTVSAMAVPGSAQLDGSETQFYNQTQQITENTTQIEVIANGTNETDVYANFYRINDSGHQTLEAEDVVLNSPVGVNSSVTHAVQTANTTAYRVVVHDGGQGTPAADVGSITVNSLDVRGGAAAFLYNANGGIKPLVLGLGLLLIVAIVGVVIDG